METTFNPVKCTSHRKLMYCTRNAKLVPVALMYPDKLEDPSYALGLVLQCEHFVHDEWHPMRTSLVAETTVADDGFDVVTRNSVYKVVDGSMSQSAVAHAQIEALFEATFIPGSHVHLPYRSSLVELFEAHATYDYFKTDDRLVNMLTDIEEERGDDTTDYAVRLQYRQPLRRFLTLCVEHGAETQCELSFTRH